MATKKSKPVISDEISELPRYAAIVLDLVDQIPAGQVLGYGDVAELLGEGGPRQVGAVMSRYGHLTHWWRVTYGNGRMIGSHEIEASKLLEKEGVSFRPPTSHGHPQIDINQHRWPGPGS